MMIMTYKRPISARGLICSRGTPPGLQVKIVDKENNTVPLSTRGELCVRGYLVFLEYYNQPDRTKEAVRDKWYYTGWVSHTFCSVANCLFAQSISSLPFAYHHLFWSHDPTMVR